MLLHKGFMPHEGEQIYFETAGARGGPVIVFTHGMGGNHMIWYQQVAFFAPFFRVITWDQRGFGRSTNVTGQSSPQKAATDLAALLEHLGVRNAHVVGQSLGGWASMGLTLQHPEKVRSLVMADTIGGIHTALVEREYLAYSARLQAMPDQPLKLLDRHPALESQFGRRGVTERAKAFLYNQISSTSLAPPVEQLRRQLPQSFWPAESVNAIKVPTLFIVGSNDDIFSPEVIRDAAMQVPGAVVREIAGAGHSPYFETPDTWNALVQEFIAAH
ncbi:MAG: alpha/beta hydrolase [Betaproteobacteria bacterium]